jgi:hypothetical protein
MQVRFQNIDIPCHRNFMKNIGIQGRLGDTEFTLPFVEGALPILVHPLDLKLEAYATPKRSHDRNKQHMRVLAVNRDVPLGQKIAEIG